VIRAYHFTGPTLRDGAPVPADGVWLEHAGPVVMCESGLHASRDPFDALQYAPGGTLCLVDVDGDVSEQSGKLAGRRRRIVARIDADALLWQFARQCATNVLHLWDAPDVVRAYLQTGNEELRAAARDAGDARAAWAAQAAAWAAQAAAWAARDAAWAAWAAAHRAAQAAAQADARDARDAAWAAQAAAWAARDAQAAAWDAAWDAWAARAAAWPAAWDAQRVMFRTMVDAAFAGAVGR
jgi:hypothetical protein